MDSTRHESPQVEQPRRSACDRCRGQKLRCERLSPNSSIEDSCRRCLKVGARCPTA
ncbi:Zn(2)-C6 fungal-type DNA-binding domain [Penicillium roqueforti FM164]|uniref:Zn(2)-C6 fungal-type DNA-binding domain n=1 Tax=Penicillium roqueforti (strain FM164) TaxID=1365484 RepID=W6QG49_PENRF|nr:Zn(2)-C6 fungal-type DNA-binding domain [Penicillium roqueforti FM164]